MSLLACLLSAHVRFWWCAAKASRLGRHAALGAAIRQHPGKAGQRLVRQPCGERAIKIIIFDISKAHRSGRHERLPRSVNPTPPIRVHPTPANAEALMVHTPS